MVPESAQGETLKDVAAGLAVTGMIVAVAVFIPIFGFFFAAFLPLPVIFYRAKLGRKSGGLVPAISLALMVGLLGGFSADVAFFAGLLLLGFLIGELLDKGFPLELTVLMPVGILLTIGGLGMILLGWSSGKGATALLEDYVGRNLDLTLAVYREMGVPEDLVYQFTRSMDRIRYVLVRIIPGLLTSSGLFIAWANLLMVKPLMLRRLQWFPDFGPLNLWKAPDQLIWVLIGCGAVLMIPAVWLKILALNGILVLMTVYFFQGIAVVSHFFEKKHFPRPVRGLLYGLLAVQQLLLLLVVGLGIFDLWLDFRRLNKAS